MTFNPDEEYDEGRVVLTVEGDFQGYGVKAYSSANAEGRTYIGNGEKEIGEVRADNYGAPFPVDLVFTGSVYPQEGVISDIRDEVGSEIQAQFDGRVDDPIETIMGSEE